MVLKVIAVPRQTIQITNYEYDNDRKDDGDDE